MPFSLIRAGLNLLNGGSVGSAVSAGLGTSPLGVSSGNDIIENVVDNSALGQGVNDSLGNSKSTSAKEIAARDSEMSYNASEAQKTRDWLERMSNTSYQRAAADLKAAGLNPALLYGSSGATTPGAGSASYSGYASSLVSANSAYRNARLSNSASFFSGIANSAISALSRLGYAAILKR